MAFQTRTAGGDRPLAGPSASRMIALGSARASDRFALACIAILVVLVAPWLVQAARVRGVWMDELWSMWMTRHDVSFRTALQERWLFDPHPVTYNAFSWLAEPALGENVFARRLLNAVWIGLFAASALFLGRRRPATAKFLVVFTALLLGGRFAVESFSEVRPYAMAFWTSATAIAFWFWACTEPDLDPRRRPVESTLLVLATVLALNVHYFSTLIAGSALIALTLVMGWRLQRKAAQLLFVAGGLAAVPLLMTLAASVPRLAASGSSDGWITTRPTEAAHMLAFAAGRGVVTNLVAAAAIALVLIEVFRRRAGRAETSEGAGTTDAPSENEWSFALATAVATVAVVAILFGVSLLRPVLVGRYLASLAVLGAAPAAALAAQRVFTRRWAVAALTANAALLAVAANMRPLHEGRWADTAERVREQVRACPGAQVYALDPDFVRTHYASRHEAEAQDWGYRLVARMYGFDVDVLRPGDGQVLRVASPCPVVIWAEHLFPPRTAVAAVPNFPFARDPQFAAALRQGDVYMGRRGSMGFVMTAKAATTARVQASSSGVSSGPGS